MSDLVRSMFRGGRVLVAGSLLLVFLSTMSQPAQAAGRRSAELRPTSHVAVVVQRSQATRGMDPENSPSGPSEAATAFPLITGGSLLLLSLLLFGAGLLMITGGARAAPPRKRDGELRE